MFSANQIAGSFNKPYLQNKSMKSWSKNFGVGMVKNGYDQSGHGALKLTVSQNWKDGMNWFFAC